jgi:hypothetical protein
MSNDLQRFLTRLRQDLPNSPCHDLSSMHSCSTEESISIFVDNARSGSFSLGSPSSPSTDSTRFSDGLSSHPPYKSPVKVTSRGKRRRIRTLYVREGDGNASFLISPLQMSFSDCSISHTGATERTTPQSFRTGSPTFASLQTGDRLPTIPLRCTDGEATSNSDPESMPGIATRAIPSIFKDSRAATARATADGDAEDASYKKDRAPVIPQRARSDSSSHGRSRRPDSSGSGSCEQLKRSYP